MAQALYDPEYGYYHQKVPIGRAGDYITAPEMTQVFGEVIAVWLIDIWQQAGCPKPFHLIELGPGRGTLMADMLRTFQSLTMPLSDMTIHLVEISPPLKALQQKTLSSFSLPFQWHKSIDTLPDGFSLIVGNEFWDALPIDQLFINSNPEQSELKDEDFAKQLIGLKDNQLVFLPVNPQFVFLEEVCPAMFDIGNAIGYHLGNHGGAALFLDYGFNGSHSDTLQAVFRHQRCSPLEYIGQADLTHHVDFNTLEDILSWGGCDIYGPIPQGDFLKAMGLDIRTERLCERATSEQRGALRTSAVRLTHPAHMGTLFKAMAVVREKGPN
ncbi:MAG: hypothetical protein K0R76_893 [Alphaproteobacteria bacterium]|nr:hypothetical protein [Alphaproteobacteria bacterium]